MYSCFEKSIHYILYPLMQCCGPLEASDTNTNLTMHKWQKPFMNIINISINSKVSFEVGTHVENNAKYQIRTTKNMNKIPSTKPTKRVMNSILSYKPFSLD